MNDLWLWFSMGLQHIADLQGYDHILFVTLVVLSLPLGEWKKLVVLITAFTLGHSVTLALSVTGWIRPPQALTEFLIAFSILVTAVYNAICFRKTPGAGSMRLLFTLVFFFGLIHGLGFSYLLRSMLGPGQNVILPLLYFNLGLEAGQLLIVLMVLLFSLFLTGIIKCPFFIYKLTLVCIIGLIALKLCVERFSQLV